MTTFPADLLYTSDHEWVRVTGGLARVGVTAHATEALGDIVYASLPTVGASVSSGDACAEVESTKAVSAVYAPVPGVVAAVNEATVDAPEVIGADPYGEGWLFELEFDGDVSALMDAQAYEALAAQ